MTSIEVNIVKRKVIIVCSMVFIVFMLVLFIFYLIKGDNSRWQVSLGGIFLSALPLLLLYIKTNPLTIPLIIGYYVFLVSSLFLGSIKSFYNDLTWWDTIVHFYKGAYIGLIGIILYKVFIPEQYRRGISRWLLSLFVLSLAVLASVLWEVYEFVGDVFFTDTMQKGGNKDTMVDLISGLAGGLVIAIYASIKKRI